MRARRIKIILLAVVLAILGACLWGLYHTGFFQAAGSEADLEAYIQGFAPWSHLAYFGIQLASVIVAPIPSNITAAVGAALFGMWQAFLLTFGAVAAGSLIVFALARGLGRGFVDRLVSRKMSEKYLDVIRRKRDVFLALAFLFPFFPDDVLCILAGLTDISFRRFAVLVLLTRPWGLLVSCAVGSSAVSIPLWGMALLGLAGLAVFLLSMKYGDRIEAAILEKLKK